MEGQDLSVQMLHSRVTIDAVPLIYFLGGGDRSAKARAALRQLVASGGELFVSTITEAELLVGPIRRGDDRARLLVQEFLSQPSVTVIDVSRAVARQAASIRAKHRTILPDAIVAATATVTSSSGLLGNDVDFRRIESGWEYLHLDDLVVGGE